MNKALSSVARAGGAIAASAGRLAVERRRRVVQVVAQSIVRRAEFRWWHGVFLLYLALLWRSMLKATVDLKSLSWQRLVVVVHVGLIKYLAGKAKSGAGLLEHVTAAQTYAADALQDLLKVRVEEFLDTQMDTLAEKTKGLLKDPYMPIAIQGTVEDFVDVLLPDLKLALFTKTEEMIVSYRQPSLLERRRRQSTASKKRSRKRTRSSLSFWRSAPSSPRGGDGGVAKDEENEGEAAQSDDDMDSVLDALQDDGGLFSSDSDEYDTSSSEEEEELFSFRDISITTPKKQGLRARRSRNAQGPGSSSSGTCLNLERVFITCRAARVRTMQALHPRVVRRVFFDRYWRLRAFVLYTYSPFDRSFWRNIRNPVYWVFQGIGLIPGIGMVWWLFVFLLHDKRDEFQLSQFLVGFQTAKFFSQGCFNLVRGAITYYLCATRDVPRCDTHGPKMGRTYDVIFFMIQIVIVWLTFFMLPDSEPCRSVNDPRHAFLLDESRRDKSQAALRAKVRLGRGGRLQQLFWWDTFFVCLVLVLFMIAFFVMEQRDWQLRSTCYFLNVLYGLSALPFVPFKIPVMGQLLTPTKSTGYTRTGATVIRVVAPPPTSVLKFQESELKRRQYTRRRMSAALMPPSLVSPRSSGSQPAKFSHQLDTVPEEAEVASPHWNTRAAPQEDSTVNGTNIYRQTGFFLPDSFEKEAFRVERADDPGFVYDSDEEEEPISPARHNRRASGHSIATLQVARETDKSSALHTRLRRNSSQYGAPLLKQSNSGDLPAF